MIKVSFWQKYCSNVALQMDLADNLPRTLTECFSSTVFKADSWQVYSPSSEKSAKLITRRFPFVLLSIFIRASFPSKGLSPTARIPEPFFQIMTKFFSLSTVHGSLMVSASLTMMVLGVDTNFGFLLTIVSLLPSASLISLLSVLLSS